jgi:hypothetical protein
MPTWCERGDSNPHGCPLDPKSSASANSATLAPKNLEEQSKKRAGLSQAETEENWRTMQLDEVVFPKAMKRKLFRPI